MQDMKNWYSEMRDSLEKTEALKLRFQDRKYVFHLKKGKKKYGN